MSSLPRSLAETDLGGISPHHVCAAMTVLDKVEAL